MTKLLDSLYCVVGLIFLLVIVVLLPRVFDYRAQIKLAQAQVQALQTQVLKDEQAAKQLRAVLTDERDRWTAHLNTLHQEREKADEANTQEIARLSDELEQRPVRVRIVTQPTPACQSGGGRAAVEPSSDPDAGSTDPAQAHGLLPASNSERLGAVIREAELINAAYDSCRNSLITQMPATESP